MSMTFENTQKILEMFIADIKIKMDFLQLVTVNKKTDVKLNKEVNSAFGSKVGSTVSVKAPHRFIPENGNDLKLQTSAERTVEIPIVEHKHVAIPLNAVEQTLNRGAIYDNYVGPMVDGIVESAAQSFVNTVYQDFYIQDGTPGTPAATSDVLDDVLQRMLDAGVDTKNLCGIWDPASYHGIQKNEKNIRPVDFHNMINKIGELPTFKGITHFTTPYVPNHAPGAGASYVTDGANQVGTGLLVKTGTGAIAKGSKITIANVNAVVPKTDINLGYVQDFTVTADYAGGGGTVSVWPPMNSTSGNPYKTVNALCADGAAVTITAAGRANMIFDPKSIVMNFIDIKAPQTVKFKSKMSKDGISLTAQKFHYAEKNADVLRIDGMWALKVVNADLGMVYWG